MSWAADASYIAVRGGVMFAVRGNAIYKINPVTGENTLFLTLIEP